MSEREITFDVEERVTPQEILDKEFDSDRTNASHSQSFPTNGGRIWKAVFWSTLAWLVALGGISTGFLIALEQKEKVLQLLQAQNDAMEK